MNPSVNLSPRSKSRMGRFMREKNYHFMVWPGVLFMLVFSYYPMVGIVMAFQNYKYGNGIFGSPWVGTMQFQMMFRDPAFWNALRNTVGISAIKMVTGFICPIVFALALNEVGSKKFKRFVQTASYLPYFISWVVVASLMTFWLGTDVQGIINKALVGLGILKEPVAFLTYPEYFWSIAVISEIWKTTGWSAIIYFAAISGIDQEMYEAATVDGAGRLRKIWNITLPAIKPTMAILLILSAGNLFKGSFDQSYLLQNAMNFCSSDIMETYVLRYGMSLGRFSMATAAGLFQSLLNVVAVLIVNGAVKLLDREQGLF